MILFIAITVIVLYMLFCICGVSCMIGDWFTKPKAKATGLSPELISRIKNKR